MTNHPALALLQEMIAIPSVNPALDATSRGEGALADFIEARTCHAPFRIWRQHVFPGRENLVIELRNGHPKTLLFEAHLDTVPVGEGKNAFEPRFEGDKLFGRGACDTKGALAAMLHALETAATRPETLACDLVLCCTIDEEHGARGIKAFVERGIAFDGAIVGEPTELQIVVAHKGCARFALETRGKAAHSSVPHQGESAIWTMFEVLRVIREEIEPELEQKIHSLCGAPSLVVGTIRGGTQVNIVPDRCEIEIDRRIVPGEDARAVMDEFAARVGQKIKGRFAVRELLLDPALDTTPDASVVRCAQSAARKLGLRTELMGVPYGSDASKLQQMCGVPSLVFGPGSIAQAHADSEYVPIADVERAAQFYLEVMRSFGREA